jgi:hypothetical protein
VKKVIDQRSQNISSADKKRAEDEAQMIIYLLTSRLKVIPKSLLNRIYSIRDFAKLAELGRCAMTCKSLREFEATLDQCVTSQSTNSDSADKT